MAVNYFHYDDRLKWKDNSNRTWASGIRWREDGKYMISNPGGYHFSLPVNASGPSDPLQEVVIFDYSNGCQLRVAYRLYVVSGMSTDTYYMESRVRLYDKDGLLVPQVDLSLVTQSRAYVPGSMPIAPYSDIYFVPGLVLYDLNNPTMEGEEAGSVHFGDFYIRDHTKLIPVDFYEPNVFATYNAYWNQYTFLSALTDEQFDLYMSYWLGNGDGSDPHDIGPGTGGDDPGDPAGSDDTSEPGGGGGNYDNTSDPIDFPELPTGGALESGAITAHRVSSQTLEAIVEKLWSKSIFDIDNIWQRSIQDPMQAIVSLHALPISPEVDGSTNIWIGNFDTELSSPEVTSQYVEVDCGSLTLNEFWGSALDYSPYTKVEIFLPFIGIVRLKTEDVMKTTIHVKYHIDVLTGDCAVFIKCGMSVLYTYRGNCKMSIPLSSVSTDAIQKTLGSLGMVAMGLSMASAGAPVGAVALGSAGVGGAGAATVGMNISAAANVAGYKSPISRSGELASNVGLMGHFVPFLIIHRPVQSLAKDYNKFKGYPSNITSKLSDLSGYTEVEHVHLQSIPNATDAEMKEITALLKSGVLL